MKFPDGKRLADIIWAVTAVVVGGWYIKDTGMWDKMSTFWQVMMVLLGASEIVLLLMRYSLSEGIWSYLPDRHIIGLAFGVLGIHLFGTPNPSHIWWLMMGHFVFAPKAMTREEIFRAALKGYHDLEEILAQYRDLAPNPVVATTAPAPSLTVSVENATPETLNKMSEALQSGVDGKRSE